MNGWMIGWMIMGAGDSVDQRRADPSCYTKRATCKSRAHQNGYSYPFWDIVEQFPKKMWKISRTFWNNQNYI
jgi:hypothetical protein